MEISLFLASLIMSFVCLGLFVCLFVSGERSALLSRLSDLLSNSSPQMSVHFEMASFVDEGIMEDLLHYIIPHVSLTETFHFLTDTGLHF